MRYFFLFFLTVTLITSCATSMIGLPIDRSSPIWNYNPSNDLKSIFQKTEHFEFTYEIKSLSDGKYSISGTGKYVGSPVFSRGITNGATFTLALAKNDLIVAYVYLPIMWRNLESDIEFTKAFESPAWDYSGISYFTKIRE